MKNTAAYVAKVKANRAAAAAKYFAVTNLGTKELTDHQLADRMVKAGISFYSF